MEQLSAKVISYVFEPIVVFLALLLALIWGQSLNNATAALVMVVLGLGIPGAVYIWEYLNDKDPQIDPGRKERNNIYLAGTFSFSLVSILFGSVLVQSSYWFYISMVFAMLMASMYLINLYFDKASFHVAAYTFSVIVVTVQLNAALAILLAVLPFLIWARITLHKHTWVEILWGLTIGLAIGLLTWAI